MSHVADNTKELEGSNSEDVRTGLPPVSDEDFPITGKCLFSKLYVCRDGVEEEINVDQLSHQIRTEKLPASAKVRRDNQEFWYPAQQLLGKEECKPLVFMCPSCRRPLKTRVIDMQLRTPCPYCSTSVTVPDRRPVTERQQIQNLKMSNWQANSRIFQGIFLGGCGLGIFMLSLTENELGLLLPSALGLSGLYLIFLGFREKVKRKKEQTKAQPLQ